MSQKIKEKKKLNALDKRILNRLQQDIDFARRPWISMAGELGIKEDHLLKRVKFLKKKGVIRRISATFNPGKIGFVSTLVAAKIAPGNIERVAKRINLYDEVTHNYKRDSEYNLWLALVAPSRKRISQIVSQIKKDKEVDGVLELPAEKLFKINVNFTCADDNESVITESSTKAGPARRSQ